MYIAKRPPVLKRKKIILSVALTSVIVISAVVGITVPLVLIKGHSSSSPLPPSPIPSSTITPAKTRPPLTRQYKSFYSLGDGWFDTGNFANLMSRILISIPASHTTSTQINMDGYYYEHSFSNGPVIPYYLAEGLNINKEFITTKTSNNKQLIFGYDYTSDIGTHLPNDKVNLPLNQKLNAYNFASASGRASMLYENEFINKSFFKSIIKPGSAAEQLITQYITPIAATNLFEYNSITAQAKNMTNKSLSNTDLIMVEVGMNDVITALVANDDGNSLTREEQDGIIIDAVNNEIDAVKQLKATNATVLVDSIPDLSLMPKFNNSKNKTIAQILSDEYNTKLYNALVKAHLIKYDLSDTSNVYYYNLDLDFLNYYNQISKLAKKDVTKSSLEEESYHINFFKVAQWLFSTKNQENADKYLGKWIYINTIKRNLPMNNDYFDDYFFFNDCYPTSWVNKHLADDILDYLGYPKL